MTQTQSEERPTCRSEEELALELASRLPAVVEELVGSCGVDGCFDHVSSDPLPDRERIHEIVRLGRQVLFPGYFDPGRIESLNLGYHLGQAVHRLYELLASQITLAIRHDCFRYDMECSLCSRQGQEMALEFIRALPAMRRLLGSDVRAALRGDPAVGNVDEVIFSYPGMLATTVYRMARQLYVQGVPILPRVMSEYAHSLTGVDIHPGAEIGQSFFIDHGTGVVVGQTAVIGQGVRLYQGVTLGALSLPPDAGETLRGAKRHPTLEDGVVVYAGATILGGDTVIGARAVIGGNVWLTRSVPPDTTVFLKEPELVYKGRKA